METQNTRLRINLNEREIEIEGSESFVREYAEKFETLLSSLTKSPAPAPALQQTTPGVQTQSVVADLPTTFGEYFHKFPKSIADVDKILIAAYYAESQEADKFFTTGSAKKLLEDQKVSVANATDCVNKNMGKKYVFSVGKRKFRVSQPGVDYINSLISQPQE
jgi:hypothetical protein